MCFCCVSKAMVKQPGAHLLRTEAHCTCLFGKFMGHVGVVRTASQAKAKLGVSAEVRDGNGRAVQPTRRGLQSAGWVNVSESAREIPPKAVSLEAFRRNFRRKTGALNTARGFGADPCGRERPQGHGWCFRQWKQLQRRSSWSAGAQTATRNFASLPLACLQTGRAQHSRFETRSFEEGEIVSQFIQRRQRPDPRLTLHCACGRPLLLLPFALLPAPR